MVGVRRSGALQAQLKRNQAPKHNQAPQTNQVLGNLSLPNSFSMGVCLLYKKKVEKSPAWSFNPLFSKPCVIKSSTKIRTMIMGVGGERKRP